MKKIQKISYDTQYASLEEAKALDNAEKSDHAWLYDRYNAPHVTMPEKGLEDKRKIKRDLEKWNKSLRPIDAPPIDELFRLVKTDTFDNGEQIQFLIDQKKFYYAPKKKADGL